MLAQWLALSGIIARGRGDRELTQRYCSEALESLPQRRYGQRLVCLSTLSNLAIADGDLWRARGLNRESLGTGAARRQPFVRSPAPITTARGYCRLAAKSCVPLMKCVRACNVCTVWRRRGCMRCARDCALYEGYLLLMRNQPDAGIAHLRAGLAEARACRDISVLIGHCVIASFEGRRNDFSKAFAELAEAERLMHIWDVPPIYYLAMITLIKCELWLAQGRTDLADAWLTRLGQTYNGEHAAAAPEFHPHLPQHIGLQQAALDAIRHQPDAALQRLDELAQHAS